MQESDKEPPSMPDILARAAIAASPRLAASLAILYEGIRDRWIARGSQAVRRAEEHAEVAGEIAPRAEGAERETVQRIAIAGRAHPVPVLAALTSLGLLEAQGVYDGTTIVKGLTPFGQALLSDLRDLDETS